MSRLLPGAVSVLLPNPGSRYPLACGADRSTLGLRVPVVEGLAGVRWPVLQSSANLADGPEARRLDEVPEEIRRAADMVIDGGELPGTASTVVDLREYETEGAWSIVRQGAVSETDVAAALQWQFHFDPDTYLAMITADIPEYDQLPERARRGLWRRRPAGARARHRDGRDGGSPAGAPPRCATWSGIDESSAMLDVARSRLPDGQVALHVARLQDPLPAGPFDLVASALCVHHLVAHEKRDLFGRVHDVLEPGGRFVLADVVVPAPGEEATVSLTPGFDNPSTLDEQLEWLQRTGFRARVTWKHRDLAVLVAKELIRLAAPGHASLPYAAT